MNGLSDLAIFILTYQRANNQKTLKLLKKYGIEKNVFLVVSDDDTQQNEYRRKYGERVIVFNRDNVVEDMMDNVRPKSGIISARNVCFELAKRLGYRYFVELDDDYSDFSFRYVKDGKLKGTKIQELAPLLSASVQVLKAAPIDAFAWGQTGDLIGGAQGGNATKVLRKCMNMIFFRAESNIRFRGRINEDVNLYVGEGKRGCIFLTEEFAVLQQARTQSSTGGMTDIYLNKGTYLKSMYSVIQDPAIVSLREMGNSDLRLHHQVNWNACVPKIISSDYKK